MTIDKAIKILQDLDTTLPQSSPQDRREAVKLGIEALSRVKEQRNPDGWLGNAELPGETK